MSTQKAIDSSSRKRAGEFAEQIGNGTRGSNEHWLSFPLKLPLSALE